MYKFNLCLRYLRTRYLAFVCIVSIMLGVATLIVVNSVMSGFSNKLKDRLLGTSADITVGTQYFGGLQGDPDRLARFIKDSKPGQHIEAIAPIVEASGMIQFEFRGGNIVKYVKAMGVDPAKQVKVGNFREYITNQKDREIPSFELSPQGQAYYNRQRMIGTSMPQSQGSAPTLGGDFLGSGPRPTDPATLPPAIPVPDLPAVEVPKPVGVIVGHSLAHWQYKDPKTGKMVEVPALNIGDTIMLATLSGDDVRPVWSSYVVVDYFKSEMSEYDSQYIYLPMEEIQRLRHLGNRATNLQIKLKPETPKSYQFMKQQVAEPLAKELGAPESGTYVQTWQDTQGPLLAAIDIERGILNLLLFMIVGVAGFGILAIFTMIVSEKYRDIGILKSLGASNRGVMGIFVWYAIFLGIVGCASGTLMGLGITHYINEIESFVTKISGQQLFDRSVYYFDKIPTNIETWTVILVNCGAMFVAVMSSLVPAVRAARLQPIQALRFE